MGKLSSLAPNTNPAAGDYLVSVNAAGTADQRIPIQNLPLSAAQIIDNSRCEYCRTGSWTAGSGGILAMDTEVSDPGSHYSISTGKYTATVAGTYLVSCGVGYGNPGHGAIITALAVNGAAETWRLQENPFNGTGESGNVMQSGSREVYLAIGSTVAVYARSDGIATGGVSVTTWLTISLKSNN
jgi:hypothetical protein